MTEWKILDEQDIEFVVECAEGLQKNFDKFVELLNLSKPECVQDVVKQNSNDAHVIIDSYHVTAGAKDEMISRFGDGYKKIFRQLESENFVLDTCCLLSELFRVAVTCQNTEVLRLLVRSGINDKRRLWDSLHLAVEIENLDIVRIVIQMGISTNLSDPERQVYKTALGLAIQKRNVDLVKLLLESGCDTEIRDGVRDNETALMLATDQGWREGWELLLKYGAKPLPENCFIEYLPLMTAIRTLKEDCVDSILILLNETLNACSSDLQREKISSAALGVAVFGTHCNIVKYLLDQNISPDRVLLSESLQSDDFLYHRFFQTLAQYRRFDYLDVIGHSHSIYCSFNYGRFSHSVDYMYAPALWIVKFLPPDHMEKMKKLLLDYRANPDMPLECFGGGSMLTTTLLTSQGSDIRKYLAEMLKSNADAAPSTWCPNIDRNSFFCMIGVLETANTIEYIKALLANGWTQNEGLKYYMLPTIERKQCNNNPRGSLNDSEDEKERLKLFNDITELISEPLKLTDLCRILVRQKLRQSNRLINVESQVSTLPAPKKVKEFLLLEDLKLW